MARAKAGKTKAPQVGPATPAPTERQRFEGFLKGFTFKWECVFDRQGRVIAEEDPDDPGGVTKYGIDKSAHPNLTADQIRNMTEDEAVQIYFTGEWPASHAGELPVPLRRNLIRHDCARWLRTRHACFAKRVRSNRR